MRKLPLNGRSGRGDLLDVSRAAPARGRLGCTGTSERAGAAAASRWTRSRSSQRRTAGQSRRGARAVGWHCHKIAAGAWHRGRAPFRREDRALRPFMKRRMRAAGDATLASGSTTRAGRAPCCGDGRRLERVGFYSDDRDRVGLEQHVQHARRGLDGVRQRRPRRSVAVCSSRTGRRPGWRFRSRSVSLEEKDQHARDGVHQDRRSEHEGDAGAQVQVSRRRSAKDVAYLPQTPVSLVAGSHRRFIVAAHREK